MATTSSITVSAAAIAARAFASLSMLTASAVPAGAVITLAGAHDGGLPVVRDGITVTGGKARARINATGAALAIDGATKAAGTASRKYVTLASLDVSADGRAVSLVGWQNASLPDLRILSAGANPVGDPNNAQALYAHNCDGLSLPGFKVDFSAGDGAFLDGCNRVSMSDGYIKPTSGHLADNVQEDNLLGGARPEVATYARMTLEQSLTRTDVIKGNLVLFGNKKIVADLKCSAQPYNIGVCEGDDILVTRCELGGAHLGWGLGVTGRDDAPDSHRHCYFGNTITDAGRAVQFSGAPVAGYTGPKSRRVDMRVHGLVCIGNGLGILADRPTSMLATDSVFHNCGDGREWLDKTKEQVLDGDIKGLTFADNHVYNGVVALPPRMTSRGKTTGPRVSGGTLTYQRSKYDLTTPDFAGRPVVYLFRWWRAVPVNGVWSIRRIEGATTTKYTQTDADIGCIVFASDYPQIAANDGTVTGFSYDNIYAGAHFDKPDVIAAITTLAALKSF